VIKGLDELIKGSSNTPVASSWTNRVEAIRVAIENTAYSEPTIAMSKTEYDALMDWLK
jgi:isocitrate dehydrogenase